MSAPGGVQSAGHHLQNAVPVARFRLAENTGSWIPRGVRPVAQPGPIGGIGHKDPEGAAERARQVSNHRIHCYNRVEPGNERGCICQSATLTIGNEIDVVESGENRIVAGAKVLLKGNEADAGRLEQSFEDRKRDGAVMIACIGRISRPADAHQRARIVRFFVQSGDSL